MISGERSVPGRWIVIGVVIVAGIMTAILGSWLFTRPRSGPAPPPSIAVLPFADPTQEYYGAGIAGQIIDSLNHIPDFHVVPRRSTLALKGKPQEVHEIAQLFNVRSVLEGTVERSGSQVHITADLINTSDGFHLFSHKYDRDAKDIFALEDDISKAVVDTLDLKPASPLPKARETGVGTYDLYLEGRFAYFHWQAEQSIPLFERVIEADPRYAPAYAGLADAYTWLGFFNPAPDDSMPKARAAAEKAMAFDEQLDSGRVALAEVDAIYDHDWDAAESEFTRALQLNPAGVNAHFAHALIYLAPLGKTKEAIEEMKHASDLDPLNPLFGTYLGFLYELDRQYDAAIVQLQKTIAMDPAFRKAQEILFRVYLDAHKTPEARAILNQLGGDDPRLLVEEGHTQEARAMIAKSGNTDKFQLACAYAALGEKSHALGALEQSYKKHEAMLVYIKTWPPLDSLHSEPGFNALLTKLNLTP